MIKLFFPKSKDEYKLFCVLFLFYLIYSYSFIFNTSIIDSITISADTYFSFDTPTYYHHGKMYLSAHPLILLFTYPIIFIGKVLIFLTDVYKLKTIFVCSICNVLVSLSSIYIYRYIKEIVCLNKRNSILITSIYSVFSTNFILSFTIESFTFSVFFISFSIYYYSNFIKNKEKIPFIACVFMPIIIGGITITNYIIAIFPIAISKDSIRNKIKKITISSIIMLAIVIFIRLTTSSAIDYGDRLNQFSGTQNFFKDTIDLFWGSSMLLPKVTSYIDQGFFKGVELITTKYYTNYYQYMIIIAITICIIYSILKGYKNKLIMICTFILIVNVVIHVFFKFGLSQPLIYGGHWVCTIPILLGWTFYYIKSKIGQNILYTLYTLIFISLLINNTIRMVEFSKIAQIIFKAY